MRVKLGIRIYFFYLLVSSHIPIYPFSPCHSSSYLLTSNNPVLPLIFTPRPRRASLCVSIATRLPSSDLTLRSFQCIYFPRPSSIINPLAKLFLICQLETVLSSSKCSPSLCLNNLYAAVFSPAERQQMGNKIAASPSRTRPLLSRSGAPGPNPRRWALGQAIRGSLLTMKFIFFTNAGVSLGKSVVDKALFHNNPKPKIKITENFHKESKKFSIRKKICLSSTFQQLL